MSIEPATEPAYRALRVSRSEFLPVRGLQYHLRVWDANDAPAARTPVTLFMLHGWMDVSASFQFLVDQLDPRWRVIAPDWRGYGLTGWPPADCYWFPDYLADLDTLLEHYSPGAPVELIGHSLGGNVAMLYSGVRPQRVARLVNLEGTGLPPTVATQAPERYARWLDEIRDGAQMRPYDSRAAVAARLMKNNPRLPAAYAGFLAGHWSRRTADGRYELLGDPAHKLINPDLYRVDEVVACWARITARVMLVLSEGAEDRHPFLKSAEYLQRLTAVTSLERRIVTQAGHMMHHDQPAQVARLIEGFVS